MNVRTKHTKTRALAGALAVLGTVALAGCPIFLEPVPPPRTAATRGTASPGHPPDAHRVGPRTTPKDPIAGAPTSDRLLVEVYTRSRTFRKGEKIALEVRVRNVSRGFLSVHRIDAAFLTVDLEDDLGRWYGCWNTAVPPVTDWDSFVGLPHNGTLSMSVALTKLCPEAKRLEPGIYRLRVRYEVPTYYDGSVFGLDAWTGIAASHEVALEVEGAPRIVTPPPPPAVLGIEIRTAAREHVAGDPIGLEVSLVNRGKSAAVVGPLDASRMDVFLTDPYGSRHACKKVKGVGKAPPDAFATLPPGARLETMLRIGAGCRLTKPGTYFVRVRYAPTDDGGRYGFGAWTGVAISKRMTFFVAPAVTPPKLVATAYLDRGTYTVGDPMRLNVVVENKGGSPTWIPTSTAFFWLRITDAWGGLVECKKKAKLPPAVARKDFERIGPGEKFVHHVNLHTRCSVAAGGSYTVQVSYIVPHRYDGRLFGFESWFTGKITAPKATVVVVSPKPTPPPVSLSLSARPLEKVLPLGGAAWVSVGIRNGGKSYAPIFGINPAFVGFEVTGPLGTIRCGPIGSRPPLVREAFYSIPAGHLVEERVDLFATCARKLKDIGRYSVRAVYQVPTSYSGASFGFSAWTGRIVAEPFAIDVFDPTPAPPTVSAKLVGPKGGWVMAGASIPVSFQLRNTGGRVFVVKPWSTGDLELELHAPGGKRFRCAPPARSKAGKGIHLFPGKTITWHGDLRKACGVSAVGIVGRYELLAHYRPAGAAAAPVAFTIKGKAKPPVVVRPPPPPPARAKLSLAAKPTGSAALGGPINVEVTVSNIGKIPAPVTKLSPGHLSFGAFTAAGKAVRCTAGGRKPDMTVRDSMAPGTSRKVVVDLRDWCAFKDGGRYRVSARASFKATVGGPVVWTGVVVAPPFWLDVRAPAPVVRPVPVGPPPKLRLVATAMAAKRTLGEPLEIKVTLRNVGKSDAWVGGLFAESLSVSGTVRCAVASPARVAADIIRRGEARETVIDVNALCPIERAGMYTLTIQATFPRPPKTPTGMTAVVYSGTVSAKPVKIKVVAPRPPPPPPRTAAPRTAAPRTGATKVPPRTAAPRTAAPRTGATKVPPRTAAPRTAAPRTGATKVPPRTAAPRTTAPRTTRPLPPTTAAPVHAKPPPPARLRLEARAAAGKRPITGPIEVSVSLRNIGKGDAMTAGLLPGYMTLDVESKTAGKVACRAPKAPGRPTADILPRGNVRVAVLDLAKLCTIRAPGRYRVIVRASLPPVPARPGSMAAPFSGTLAAKGIYVDVIAPKVKAPPRPVATAKPIARVVPPPGGGKPPPRPGVVSRGTVITARPRPGARLGAPLAFEVTVTPGAAADHPMPMRFQLWLTGAKDPRLKVTCASTWGRPGPAKRIAAGEKFVAVPKFKCKVPAAGRYRAEVGYRIAKGPWAKSRAVDIVIGK